MKIAKYLEISTDPKKAVELMQQYASQVVIEANKTTPRLIAGTDVSYVKEQAYAVIVVVDREDNFNVVETVTWVGSVDISYKPGLFTFRESPCLLKAFEKLNTQPDVILLDANGIIHPHGFGVACHIGICLNIPAIGCAKSLLLGKHDKLPNRAGEFASVYHQEKELGIALRTRTSKAPIYVSPGYKFDIATAKNLVMDLIDSDISSSDKQPTPLQKAHNLTVKLRKSYNS